MGKWRSWLLGQQLSWLSNGGGLTMFFESDKFHKNPIHMINRWRAELLQYQFIIDHRSEFMMTECDLLSCYNAFTLDWRLPSKQAPPLVDLATTSSDVSVNNLEYNTSPGIIPLEATWQLSSLPPVFGPAR
jgi:hypothetical protein